MHKHLISLILALACLVGNNPVSASDSKPSAIYIYIASDTKIEGGRYIDTPACPKAGYIPARPAMIINSLESVESLPGKKELQIKMYLVDAKRFEALTENNVGKKTLIMLGDTPILAATIQEPITTPSFGLSVGQLDKNKIEDDLRKLIK